MVHHNDIKSKPLHITLHYQGAVYEVYANYNEYYSLMTLIADNLAIPGFGLCCGMGSCGTCVVQIAAKADAIKRAVMACSISIDDGIANKQVFIPDIIY